MAELGGGSGLVRETRQNGMNPGVIVERTKTVLTTLGAPVPDDATIRAEIDVDQRFIGEDYAVASPESSTTPAAGGSPSTATSRSCTPETPATCSRSPK